MWSRKSGSWGKEGGEDVSASDVKLIACIKERQPESDDKLIVNFVDISIKTSF